MNYNDIFKLDQNSWFDFEQIYDEAVDHFDNAHFIEVGSWQGASAAYLALKIKEKQKSIKVYCVDLWTGDPANENEQRIVSSLPPMKQIFKENMESLGITTVEGIYNEFHKSDIIMLEGNSNDILPKFNNADLVFIDGGHGYDQVIQDIRNAKKIINPGGWIAGHDYPTVRKAVHSEFTDVEAVQTSRSNDKTNASWIVRNVR